MGLAPNSVVGNNGADEVLPGPLYSPGKFDGRGDDVFTGAGNDVVDVELGNGFQNRIFTGSGADVIYAGSRDVITGGDGNDELWANSGDGNRLSGLGGDDGFVIGSSGNRALGGDGSDVFTILGDAGTNHLNGGKGADQFWLVSGPGDMPMAKQFVMDFTAGEDKVGLRGVAFADISFSQVGADTLLKVAGVEVGHFTNIGVSALNNQANFAGLL
jgi:glycerophosphoryl diester phosphodiesterase